MDPRRFEYPRASRTDTTESILLSVASRLKGKNLRRKREHAYVRQAFDYNNSNKEAQFRDNAETMISSYGNVYYNTPRKIPRLLVMTCKLDVCFNSTTYYLSKSDRLNTFELFHTLLITVIVSRHI